MFLQNPIKRQKELTIPGPHLDPGSISSYPVWATEYVKNVCTIMDWEDVCSINSKALIASARNISKLILPNSVWFSAGSQYFDMFLIRTSQENNGVKEIPTQCIHGIMFNRSELNSANYPNDHFQFNCWATSVFFKQLRL